MEAEKTEKQAAQTFSMEKFENLLSYGQAYILLELFPEYRNKLARQLGIKQ